jgi:8-oxo-dGTP pyrophosphatase MutT (NUDIX family)
MPEDIWQSHLEIRKQSAVLFETPWFQVLDYESYGYVSYPDRHVVILPVVLGHGIVMVKVRRPVLGGWTWELPAGGCLEGETEQQAASRELQEETGVIVGSLSSFIPQEKVLLSPTRLPISPSIFRVDISMEDFRARQPHDDEIQDVRLILFDEVKRMMLEGRILVSMPLAILGRYFLTS